MESSKKTHQKKIVENKIVVWPEAETDLREVYLWYENHRPGLGDDFILSIKEIPKDGKKSSPLERDEHVILN